MWVILVTRRSPISEIGLGSPRADGADQFREPQPGFSRVDAGVYAAFTHAADNRCLLTM